MKDIRNIIKEFKKIPADQDMALATVVRVRGSSYRSPGARMLIRKDGRWTGSISGGCLEGDALRKARDVMVRKQSRLVTYNTMDDENNSLGVGLGCNGIIDVLLDPIIRDGNHPIKNLEAIANFENLTVVATVFSSEISSIRIGEQLWLDENQNVKGRVSDDSLKRYMADEMASIFHDRRAAVKSYLEGQVEIFFEIIEPPLDLIIFGGGFDAKPVTLLAHTMGWDVTVTDECVAHVAPVNFPEANVLFCKREHFTSNIVIKSYSAALLMSHTYAYDLAALEMLSATDINYIGILGPRKRAEKMFLALKKKKIHLSATDMHRIHSPVGIDIGAETPEEIALSIIAEIQAKFANRSGGYLKYRQSPIHHRDGKEDQIFKQVYLSSNVSKKAFL